ncbi:hypothetical protein JHK85_048952 [Glycine max]|uniref:Reverse transcriptase/retrotransposon-derived protein RNase H-like domain-containing protein n=1 Tax=Glycine max TaxID=3847 RepID=A0A0R0FGJ2_SOYBN|nr:hypothetical protein JHK85_048952 [Glycine max]
MNEELLQYCQKEIKDLLDKGLIRKKLERGTPRLVINYKPLNQALQWIRYPIPNKKDLLNRLNFAKIFSKFDMKSGFWQIQIQESDRSDIHTQTVKDIKLKVQSIKCLYLPIRQAFKIVEIDASDIGYGGILKQRNISRAPQTLYLTILPMNSYRKILMPPKVSGTSLRGGKSIGKGFKLALPEPTIKRSSSTSPGSPTQAGASSLKPKKEGSSTQIVTIKPEPSTQEPPKPATMEPEYWDKNPFKATAKAFPPGFQFKPTAINKIRTFYEFILIDSNSVSIKHFKDPKDQSLNTHSTIQILKVMQPRQFGPNLNQAKEFSALFDLVGYTYWDYIDAGTKVFWYQNTRFKHSWLIYLKTNTVYNFPNWNQEFQQTSNIFLVSFILDFLLAIQVQQNRREQEFPVTTEACLLELEQVRLWFKAHPELLKADDPKTSLFLNQKSQLATFLASAKSKESLAKNLKEVLQILQQEEDKGSSSKKEETNSSEEDDPFYQNEDDCFGISLNDD